MSGEDYQHGYNLGRAGGESSMKNEVERLHTKLAACKALYELNHTQVGFLERILRKELWRNHGCPMIAMYGDDGEMQCGQCITDFKRTPIEELIFRVEQNRLKTLFGEKK